MKMFSFIFLFVSTVFVGANLQPTQEDIDRYLIDDTNIDYSPPTAIRDTASALRLGMLLFHAPFGAKQGSCGNSQCHSVAKAGFPTVPFAIGNMGLFDQLMSKYTLVELDVQGVRSMPIVNSLFLTNGLTGGELGRGGFNKDVPLEKLTKFKPQNANPWHPVYLQADVGFGAHNINNLISVCKDDHFIDSLSKEAFYIESFDRLAAISAIGMFEMSVLPTQSPFQRWLKGEGKLKSPDGFLLFKQYCVDCHSGPAFGNQSVAMKIGESDFEGRYRMTKDSADYGMVKVPQLYNIKDAPALFHSANVFTSYKAEKAHNLGISRSDMRKIDRFQKYDLYDPNMNRYFDY